MMKERKFVDVPHERIVGQVSCLRYSSHCGTAKAFGEKRYKSWIKQSHVLFYSQPLATFEERKPYEFFNHELTRDA